MSEWRVGQHYEIHVYEGDRPVATFHGIADARRAVAAVNGDMAADVLPGSARVWSVGWSPTVDAASDTYSAEWPD
jgi:hypothetical protein